MYLEEKESSSHPAARGVFDLRITGLSAAELDRHPAGVIRLDRAGVVTAFNAHEEHHARRSRDSVIGKNFFYEVAPCARVQDFHGRFLAGVEDRELDATFGFVFPFPHGDRYVFVTLFYQGADDSIWVIIRDRDIGSN